MLNATAPSKKIPTDLGLRKTSPWVDAPTVKPRKIVAVSMTDVLAVLARRSTTPDSFMMLPKKKGPSSGMEAGARKQQRNRATTGKISSSVLETRRESGIRIRRSWRVVKSLMIGG